MEMTRLSPFRGFSVRSILGFALAVIITALLWAILASPAAHAEDAEWDGASIKYGGIQYISAGKVQNGDGSGLPVDSPYYLYVEKYQAPGSSTSSDRARIIYFSPGVDPPTATTAKSVYFEYDANTKTFSNPYEQKDITLTPQSASPNAGGTSCAIEGIGWAVCPVMNFLAGGMDFVFGVIAQYMEVQPLETGNIQGSLYSAWNIMRNIANVVFIIAFLIIIYAQITSYKTAEFGLKRLLPRLIIAAVAINLSYIICAIAVDLSNVLGYSLQDVFYGLRDQILDTGSTDNTAQIFTWESITAFVISGGTAVLAAGVGVGALLIASGGSIVAAVFLLLPSLVGLLIAVLVVLLILAARQALIVILVIIAPVAIVLYLLPNTEKWFNKWRDLFMTLLIFFPAFSVVFGGSQLAGAVIIKNATSINLVILGMIVQVAPLVITPLLLKFSGSLLGGIARLVNDPNKGILDRTRKWSGEHAERHRKRGISGNAWNGDPGQLTGRNVLRRSARRLDQRKQRRADLNANADTAIKTNYENSNLYTKTDRHGNEKYNTAIQKAAFEADKTATHDAHSSHVEQAKRTQGSLMYNRAYNVEAGKEILQSEQNFTTEHYNRQRTMGGTALNHSMTQLEASKLRMDASDNDKNIYVSQEKQRAGSTLNGLVGTFEASKVNLDGSQQRYTAMVENMKIDPTNALHAASITAQSSKEQVEAAQQRVQVMFDQQRLDPTSVLHASMQDLEVAKGTAEGARAEVATYIATQKSEIGTPLHTTFTNTEMLKQQQQIADSRFTRILEEYKAGGKRVTDAAGVEHVYINDQEVFGTDLNRATDMVQDSARLASENQGATSAKYVQQEYVATMMNETTTTDAAFTDQLLTTAGGIDPQGKIRAQANASTQIDKLRKEALTNSITLLGDQAEAGGVIQKALAKEIYQRHIGAFTDATGAVLPQEDHPLIEAALEVLAQEGEVPTLRDARMNLRPEDQGLLTSVFARNSGTMKAKGGFDLQANPGLANATREQMNASIAATLGSTASTGYPDLKNSEIVSHAANIADIMRDTDNATDPTARAKGQEGLRNTYAQLTSALNDPRIRTRLGDNLIPAIDIHAALDARFNNNPQYHVTYADIDPRVI